MHISNIPKIFREESLNNLSGRKERNLSGSELLSGKPDTKSAVVKG